METMGIYSFYDKLVYLTKENYYGDYILEHYSHKDIQELESYMKDERNEVFTYSGLELIMKRYLDRKSVV